MGGAQTEFMDKIKALTADPRIGYLANDLLTTIMGYVSQHVDLPCRAYASTPADAYLNFASSGLDGTMLAGDQAGKVFSPISNVTPSFTASKLNFQTGASVGSGSFLYNNSTFAIPSSTSGKYRRFVFALQSTGAIAINYGNEQTAIGSLEDPAVLAASLGGTPFAYVHLVATATSSPGAYKTVGVNGTASVTSIIENNPSNLGPALFRYVGGGGSGSSGGGGAGLIWTPSDGLGAASAQEGGCGIYLFPLGGTAQLEVTVHVPSSYIQGNKISLRLGFYSPDTTGTVLLQTVASLVRPGVDSVLAPTLTHSSTNTAVNLATAAVANTPNLVICDLTDTSGKIGGSFVQADNVIRVLLTRGTDTAVDDARFMPDYTLPTFS